MADHDGVHDRRKADDAPPGYEQRAKDWPAAFGRIEQLPQPLPTLSLRERMELVLIAHATSDRTIRKHALLVLEHDASPAFVVVRDPLNASTQADDLPNPRPLSSEEQALKARKPIVEVDPGYRGNDAFDEKHPPAPPLMPPEWAGITTGPRDKHDGIPAI